MSVDRRHSSMPSEIALLLCLRTGPSVIRNSLHFDPLALGLSVCIQKMVRSDLGVSGVAFSLDTESGFRDVVVINGSYGLGELIVQGSISPDEFIVFKPNIGDYYIPIIEKKLGKKDQLMVYGDDPDERVKIIPTEKSAQNKFCLEDAMILRLANWVTQIEKYYTRIKGKWCPVDVEWAVDGLTGTLFIVQARPETIHSRKDHASSHGIRDETAQRKAHFKGHRGRGQDRVRKSAYHVFARQAPDGREEFKEGDVLVTDMTDPDWEPIMKKAAAIITNKGGRTCHAAIVAREMGVPAIVGCGNATEKLKPDQLVTASCGEGDVGLIYNNRLSYSMTQTNLNTLPKIKTDLMLNVGSPGTAFQYAQMPHKGVGLAREEFIINNYIGIHPLALITHHKLNDDKLSDEIYRKNPGL